MCRTGGTHSFRQLYRFKLAFDALKFAHTVGESALESCLLRVKFANDSGFVFAQFGIDLAVIRNNGFGNFAE